MCGRIDFHMDTYDPAVLRLRQVMAERFPGQALPEGEGFPGTKLPVLVAGGEKAAVALMQWGLPGQAGRLIINARAETAEEKPGFRESFLTRRCALVTTGFYEWSHEGAAKKFLFRKPGSNVLYLAGFFDRAERFVVLTEAANGSVADVHSRMPVILEPGEVRPWLADAAFARAVIRRPGPILTRVAAEA
jgi:putative SOS response-associated peptidase YedK